MRILLTGGAGFIASHLAESYYYEGHEVIIVDNLHSGSKDNLSSILGKTGVSFYQTDIRDQEALHFVFAKHKPDIVNHHAAQKSVPLSLTNPGYDADINIIGLLNLLQMTKLYPINNFIYVSSGGALATEITDNTKSKETDIPQLKTPYAISKFTGEQYIRIYAELNEFDYTILRYSNVYGPRQTSDGECGVIPIFVNNIMNGTRSRLLTYPDMPKGCSRDYLFVSDVVRINLLVTRNPLNQVINVSSSKEMYMLDIYEEIQRVFGSNIPIDITGPRLGDSRRSVLDSSLALQLTGWNPVVDFSEGLEIIRNHIKEKLLV